MTEENDKTPAKEEGKEEVKKDKAKETKEEEKSKSTDPIGEAKAILEATRVENDRREKLLSEEKELQAVKMLGGGSPAGSGPAAKKEETNQEYVERMRANGWKADG